MLHVSVNFPLLGQRGDKSTAGRPFLLRRGPRLHFAVMEAGIKKVVKANTAAIITIRTYIIR